MRDMNRLRQKEFPNLDPIQKVLDFPLCKLKIRINDHVSTPRHVQFSFKMQNEISRLCSPFCILGRSKDTLKEFPKNAYGGALPI